MWRNIIIKKRRLVGCQEVGLKWDPRERQDLVPAEREVGKTSRGTEPAWTQVQGFPKVPHDHTSTRNLVVLHLCSPPKCTCRGVISSATPSHSRQVDSCDLTGCENSRCRWAGVTSFYHSSGSPHSKDPHRLVEGSFHIIYLKLKLVDVHFFSSLPCSRDVGLW